MRNVQHLLGDSRQRGALEALGDFAAQVVGVVNALEKGGVLRHALDAKGIVHAPHRCNQHTTNSLFACTLLDWSFEKQISVP